jgi:UDP-2,4-diacetamido-2,4,6-trideoxy-beta-L-altropyranose hydrolase
LGEPTLLIRADANVSMGTGHVMRCLALAQAWQDKGGSVVFAMVDPASCARERLLQESMGILEISEAAGTNEDAARTAALARQHEAVWVVVDGYQFGAGYQQALKSAGVKILFLDDYGQAAHYCADVVLNQNISGEESTYNNREPYTQLLLGPKYCLLRREFSQWRDWQREIRPVAHRVVVTMGGSDPQNCTLRVMQALAATAIEGLEPRVVVGASNPHFESLERYASQNAGRIAVWRGVSKMAELMAWADIAVSSAGTTTWELAFMGLPSLLLASAKHQLAVAEAVERSRAGINLGWFSETDDQTMANAVRELLADGPLRKEMAANGRGLVDGQGAGRVVSVLAKRSA